MAIIPPRVHMQGCSVGGGILESVLARICREARGRVRTNLVVRDMDVPAPDVHDERRLEVVVEGLPLRGCGPNRHRHDDGVCIAL